MGTPSYSGNENLALHSAILVMGSRKYHLSMGKLNCQAIKKLYSYSSSDLGIPSYCGNENLAPYFGDGKWKIPEPFYSHVSVHIDSFSMLPYYNCLPRYVGKRNQQSNL